MAAKELRNNLLMLLAWCEADYEVRLLAYYYCRAGIRQLVNGGHSLQHQRQQLQDNDSNLLPLIYEFVWS